MVPNYVITLVEGQLLTVLCLTDLSDIQVTASEQFSGLVEIELGELDEPSLLLNASVHLSTIW